MDYNKFYKLLLAVPVIITLLSLVYIGFFYSKHNDFILKDVTLSGGTTITLQGDISKEQTAVLKSKFSDISIRKLTDIRTGKSIASIIESSAEPEELKKGIEESLGYKLTDENSSTEFSGSSLSSGFYMQLVIALAIAFLLISAVIFILFKSLIPSMAIIFSIFSDIVVALALVNFFGITLSAAGIAAFLMLIGYSVDTNILLTTRALKNTEGTLNERIFHSFKTGILMTITSLFAVLPAFFIVTGLPDSFRQIFLILAFGLSSDVVNTWLMNAGIIKWYCDRRGIK